MFREVGQGYKTALVFTGKGGKHLSEVSRTFDRCVDELKLNEGIENRRQKLTFHNLRHTFASWLLDKNVKLFTVGKLLGHTTMRMTERYSHLKDGEMKKVVEKINNIEDMGKVIPLRPVVNG
jgi:integrase